MHSLLARSLEGWELTTDCTIMHMCTSLDAESDNDGHHAACMMYLGDESLGMMFFVQVPVQHHSLQIRGLHTPLEPLGQSLGCLRCQCC